jgi:hypothetical protein
VGDGSPVASGGQEVEECKGGRCCTILPGQAVVGKENGEGGRGARAAIFCPAGREKESGGSGATSTGRRGGGGGGWTRGVWRATGSYARGTEAATIGRSTDRGGSWLMCGPTATVPGGGEI